MVYARGRTEGKGGKDWTGFREETLGWAGEPAHEKPGRCSSLQIHSRFAEAFLTNHYHLNRVWRRVKGIFFERKNFFKLRSVRPGAGLGPGKGGRRLPGKIHSHQAHIVRKISVAAEGSNLFEQVVKEFGGGQVGPFQDGVGEHLGSI